MKKLIAMLLAFAMLAAGAALAETADNEVVGTYLQGADEVVVTDTCVTFTDDSGRGEISIEKNPQRVAVLYGSLACLWYEAGGTASSLIGGDNAVGLYQEQIGRDITQDEGVVVVSESSNGSSWDIETIIAQKPDLIVCSMGMNGYKNISGPAEATGIPVIGIQYDEVQDYLKWFKIFCNLNGQPELWDSIANATAEKIIEVVSRVPADVEAPSVLVLYVASGMLKAYDATTSVGTIVNELGGENVVNETVEISLEEIYALNPDIILIPERDAAGSVQQIVEETLGGNAVWEALDAVKNDKVVFLEKGLFHNKPNQYYRDAYEKMFAILYPDAEL